MCTSFNNFFKNYTEKVWGIDCKNIGSDWAAQRIKGLSLSTAIKFALFPNSKKRPKTLIDKFYYPKLGAGMLWEKFEKIIIFIISKGIVYIGIIFIYITTIYSFPRSRK